MNGVHLGGHFEGQLINLVFRSFHSIVASINGSTKGTPYCAPRKIAGRTPVVRNELKFGMSAVSRVCRGLQRVVQRASDERGAVRKGKGNVAISIGRWNGSSHFCQLILNVQAGIEKVIGLAAVGACE